MGLAGRESMENCSLYSKGLNKRGNHFKQGPAGPANRTGRKAPARGITLIEIFVVLAVVAVLLASAATPLERMSARVDVDIARENIVHALRSAQHSAIRANTPVRVFLSGNTLNNRLIAGFSRHRRPMDFYYLPNYTLPKHVTVKMTEGMSMIEYLPIGRVSSMGVISLSSTIHPDYVVNIRIANAAGHLEVDDGLMQKIDRIRGGQIEL